MNNKRKILINIKRIVGTSTLRADIRNITPDIDKASIVGFRGVGTIPPGDETNQGCTFNYSKETDGIYTFLDILEGNGPRVVDLGDNAGKTKHNVCDQLNTLYGLTDTDDTSLQMVLNLDGLLYPELEDLLT